MHACGPADPALRLAPGQAWWALRGDDGPVTLQVQVRAGAVEVRAWGGGADTVVAGAGDLLGCGDDPQAFRPAPGPLADLHRRSPQLRLGRHPRVFDTLVATVLQQKVTAVEAYRAWRALLHRHGVPAPRPPDAPPLLAPPPPRVWRDLPVWEWHHCGVERRRSLVIRNAAAVARRMDALAAVPSDRADTALRSLPGVGPWTSAEVRQRTHGDPDALSVGDYHLPKLVGQAFTGEPTDDEGMLALLAPYRGQRHRVARLLLMAGVRVPRRAPRARLRDFASM